MLVFLQHNVAHLGIVTGLCLAEAATTHLPLFLSGFLLLTAVAASIATALAEILGGALAISMLTGMPVIPVALLFAVALFFAGIASTMTAGMAGGTICAGIFGEVYNIKDYHSWHGVALTYVLAVVVICFITDPFKGLVYSQIVLSVQLPLTVFTQIYLTSSPKVMGVYANTKLQRTGLSLIALIVTILNIFLLIDVFS
jgi:putative Mn transporter, NRAMR family